MTIQKLSIYAVLRSSEEPMTLAGLIALLHRQTGSRDPLHLFDQIEREHVVKCLNELVEEGRVEKRSVMTEVFQVTSSDS